MQRKRVSIAIGDARVGRSLEVELRGEGFAVRCARDPDETRRLLLGARLDAAVIGDDLFGASVVRWLADLRADCRTRDARVLWVGPDDEAKRAACLAAGADDAVDVQRGARELRSRIQALMRRGPWAGPAMRPDDSGVAAIPCSELGEERGRARLPERAAALSLRERQLLCALVAADGAVVRREELVRRAFGTPRGIGARAVDTYVNRLRAKLGADGDLVETVRGVGYRWRGRLLSSS